MIGKKPFKLLVFFLNCLCDNIFSAFLESSIASGLRSSSPPLTVFSSFIDIFNFFPVSALMKSVFLSLSLSPFSDLEDACDFLLPFVSFLFVVLLSFGPYNKISFDIHLEYISDLTFENDFAFPYAQTILVW